MSKTLFGRLRDFCFLVLLLLVTGTSFAAPPRAKNIYIAGSVPGANPASGVTGMKVLHTLYVYYTYIDPDGQAQAGTTIQWMTFDDELGTNPQPIAGATGTFYSLQAAQLGNRLAAGT